MKLYISCSVSVVYTQASFIFSASCSLPCQWTRTSLYPNGISIGSAVFPQLVAVTNTDADRETDRLTDTQTALHQDMRRTRPHTCSLVYCRIGNQDRPAPRKRFELFETNLTCMTSHYIDRCLLFRFYVCKSLISAPIIICVVSQNNYGN